MKRYAVMLFALAASLELLFEKFWAEGTPFENIPTVNHNPNDGG